MTAARHQFFPDLLPEEYDLLKASIADHGVEVPIIVDQEGNTIDGLHRQRACDELGIDCPREVRHFETEAEKVELALRLNCRRRQLNRKQKRELIAAYLKCDPQIADNYLAELIGGISKNTVADVRTDLEATCLIDKFETLRGKDGKDRPTKYKRIIANTPKEAETAQEIVGNLPDNCAGKVIDTTTAQRRARRNVKQLKRAEKVVIPFTHDDIKLHCCRFQELEQSAGIEPNSVKLILTDIPYDGGFVPQVSDLASLASRILVDGGLLVMQTGQYHIEEVERRLKEHLIRRWWGITVWEGDANLIHPLQCASQYKPVVIYSKGNWKPVCRWGDVSRVTVKEKDWYPWQQPLEDVEFWLRQFSEPGDLVCDVCSGSFTVAVACLRNNRRFVGCDSDESCVQIGQQRLTEEITKLSDPPIVADTSDQETQDWSPAHHFSSSEVEHWKRDKLTATEESLRRFFADKSWFVGGPIPLRLSYGSDSMTLVRETESTSGLGRVGDLLGQDVLGQLTEQMQTRDIDEKYYGGLALLYLRLCRGIPILSEQAELSS